jgi:hypothetical protein
LWLAAGGPTLGPGPDPRLDRATATSSKFRSQVEIGDVEEHVREFDVVERPGAERVERAVAQMRLTSLFEIPRGDPSAWTTSSSLRVERPWTYDS